MVTVYSATTWVASTAPGISAGNLNNLETQFAKGVAYYNEQIGTEIPLVPTSIGAIGTSTKWATGDHQHPYLTRPTIADSVTGGVLAFSMSGNYGGAGGSAYPMMGTVVQRDGVYHVHMLRDGPGGGTVGVLSLYSNNVSVASVNLATTAELDAGEINVFAGDVLYTLFSESATGGLYYTKFFNADGWW